MWRPSRRPSSKPSTLGYLTTSSVGKPTVRPVLSTTKKSYRITESIVDLVTEFYNEQATEIEENLEDGNVGKSSWGLDSRAGENDF